MRSSRIGLIVWWLVICTAALSEQAMEASLGSIAINGDYVGLEPMKSVTPDDPRTQWFHENKLVVRNGDAILDMVPVSISRGVKSYSASDGGFLTYRGRFFQKDGQTFVSLRLFESDYIAFPIGGCEPYSKVNVVPVKRTSNGLEIEGVRYVAKRLSKREQDRFTTLLKKEPMEYTGQRPYRRNSKAPVCQ